jgi:hypothetical protein
MFCGYLCILQFLHLFSWLCNECNTLLVVGKELEQIASELIEEFKELTKLPSINFAIQKSKELYAKVSDILLDSIMCAVCSCFWLEAYDRCKIVCMSGLHWTQFFLVYYRSHFQNKPDPLWFFSHSDKGRLHEHEVYQVHTIVWSQFRAADYFAMDCKNAKAFR